MSSTATVSSVTLPWPQTVPGGSPIGALYAQNYFAARDATSSSFAVTLVEKKEVVTFTYPNAPIAAWKLFDNLIFVIHEDGTLQIVNPLLLQSVKLETEKSDFFLDDDAPSQIAVSDKWIVVCIKRGVAYWERDSKNRLSVLSSVPKAILLKGTSVALDSVKIEGDIFFYAQQATWRLLDLAAEKRVDTFEWTVSVGHYFKFEKLDRVIVGTKSDSIVIFNLEAKTAIEVKTERFITALSLDQTFLITGDSDGNVQLRKPLTGEVLFGLKYVEDDKEASVDEALNADEDERAFQGDTAKNKKKKKSKDDQSERSKIRISLTSRINAVKRVGRYVVAAHEDSYISLWDVNKSTKRPIQTVNTSGPIRYLTISDDGFIEAGTLFDPKKVGKAVKPTVKEFSSSSMASTKSIAPLDEKEDKSNPLRRSVLASKDDGAYEKGSSDSMSSMTDGTDSAKKKFSFNLKQGDSGASLSRRMSTAPKLAAPEGKPIRSENAALMVELIRWRPKLFTTGATPAPASLPFKPPEGDSMQDAICSFSTSVDWFEYELKQAPFTVLVFWRGLWCKSCANYLPAWNRILGPIQNLGGRIIGVTSDSKSNVAEFKKRVDVDFTLLSDPTNELANYYHAPISKGPPYGITATDINGGAAPFPLGMVESSVFIISRDRKFYFKWMLKPALKNSFGGLGRPDPVDVWKYVGLRIEKGKVPDNLKIKVGDPISRLGWRKRKIEDLPGGRVIFSAKSSPNSSVAEDYSAGSGDDDAKEDPRVEEVEESEESS